MQNRRIEFSLRNISFYLAGFIVLGFGVISLIRSDLGAGAWDTVTANLSALLGDALSLGTVSLMISTTIMIVVILYSKKWVLIGMLVPMGLVALSIDFWDIVVFGTYTPTIFLHKVLLYGLGALAIPLGLAFVISSKFPAFVFDELTIMVMGIFKTKNVAWVRLGIELLGILFGILFGVLAGIGLGAVNVGSVVLSFILPPLLAFYIKKIGVYNE